MIEFDWMGFSAGIITGFLTGLFLCVIMLRGVVKYYRDINEQRDRYIKNLPPKL